MYHEMRLFTVIMFLLFALFMILNRYHVVQVLELNTSLFKPKMSQLVENITHVLLDSNQRVSVLKNKYNLDWEYNLKRSPWSIAREWMSTTHVHPQNTPELGKLYLL